MSVRDYEKVLILGRIACAILLAALPSRALAQLNSNTQTVQGVPEAPTVTKFSLRWKGLPNCDARDRVLARVQELIEEPIEMRLSEPLVVHAIVEQDADTMRVQLTLLDKLGVHERVLEGASCSELVEATALVLVLAINQFSLAPIGAQVERSPHDGRKDGVSGGEHSDVATAPLRSSRAQEVRGEASSLPSQKVLTKPEILVGSTVEGRLGLFPGLARGIGISGSFERLPVLVSVSVAWLNAEKKLNDASALGVGFDALLLSPRLCWFGATSGIAVGPCASATVGVVWANALGVKSSTPMRHGFESSGLGLTARLFHRDSAYLALDADVVVPWRRTRYLVAGDEVHRADRVGGRLGIQLGLAF